MDCFYIFCDSVGLSPGPQCWIPTLEHMLVHMSIAQLVHMLHANEPITVPEPPKTIVLGRVPFRMKTETDAEWVVAAVSGWDDTVGMSPLCLVLAQCTK